MTATRRCARHTGLQLALARCSPSASLSALRLPAHKSAPAHSLCHRLGYHEEELLLTKVIPAHHKHPNRQCHS
jgi:hypothetical protein